MVEERFPEVVERQDTNHEKFKLGSFQSKRQTPISDWPSGTAKQAALTCYWKHWQTLTITALM